MTIEERLSQTIDEQEERISELEEENRILRAFVPWTEHTIAKEDAPLGLPLPRLEIVWKKLERDPRGYDWRCTYQLVYRHLVDDVVSVPLGETKITWTREPVGSDGKIELPFRDGAHIHHDAMELDLPAFVRYGDRAQKIDPTQHLGAQKARREREP